MRRDLKLEAFYPHPPELVWQALADSKALAEWLMENNFEPRVGAKFQFHTKPGPGFDGIVDCEVLEVDAPRRLSYSWRGGWSSKPTVVTFTLVPEAGGTRLLLQHTGFEGSRAIALSYLLGSGWGRLLHRGLPAYFEQPARRQS